MTHDYLRLGKIKKSILDSLNIAEEDDRTVYVLSDFLNSLTAEYPDSYLRKLEGMKEILSNPDYVSKGQKRIHLYRLYFENERFYLTILSLEKKQRWIFKSLQAHSYPMSQEELVVRLAK